MSEWKRIDTAPKDGTEIDIWVQNSIRRIAKVHWDQKFGMWANHEDVSCNPTHWMPIPEPPKEDEDE